MADLVITPANVVTYAGGSYETGTAGATITAGQTLYKDSTDSDKLKLADANASSATATVVGVALHAASAGQPIRYQTGGDINPGATVAVGTTYIQSATAGGICPDADATSGHFKTILGIGQTASKIRLNIINGGVAVP